MKKVFIAGSRRLSRIPPEVRQRLDEMIRRELTILVGDANGADKAVQSYFAEQKYADVTIYCTGGGCRNNVGGWPIRGQSSGTIVNVARLVARGKPPVIYASPAKAFTTLKTPEDLIDFLSAADSVVRAKLNDYIHEHVAEFAQPQIF